MSPRVPEEVERQPPLAEQEPAEENASTARPVTLADIVQARRRLDAATYSIEGAIVPPGLRTDVNMRREGRVIE